MLILCPTETTISVVLVWPLMCCMFHAYTHCTLKYTYPCIFGQWNRGGVHFLFHLFHGVMTSRRGQHRWLTANILFSSLAGPKCFGERRSLGTMTSEWSRYYTDFMDLWWCRVISERFRTSAIKTSSSAYLSKSKDVINCIWKLKFPQQC